VALNAVEPGENGIKLLVSDRSGFQSLFDSLHSLRQCEVLLLKPFEIPGHFFDKCFKPVDALHYLGDFRSDFGFERFFHVQDVSVQPFKLPIVLGEVFVGFFEALVDLIEALVHFIEALVDLIEALVDFLEASVDLFELAVVAQQLCVDQFKRDFPLGWHNSPFCWWAGLRF
jgi:hypothetical protein